MSHGIQILAVWRIAGNEICAAFRCKLLYEFKKELSGPFLLRESIQFWPFFAKKRTKIVRNLRPFNFWKAHVIFVILIWRHDSTPMDKHSQLSFEWIICSKINSIFEWIQRMIYGDCCFSFGEVFINLILCVIII